MDGLKVLVCGDVLGQWGALFDKVSSIIQAKGRFDVLFCLGCFFPRHDDDELEQEMSKFIKGTRKVPLPTFFVAADDIGAKYITRTADEATLATNLTYLGPAGVRTILGGPGGAGLSVAYVSGEFDPTAPQSATRYTTRCSQFQIDCLLADRELYRNGVDVLLTNDWPLGVLAGVMPAQGPPPDLVPPFSEPLRRLALELAPRYHFARSPDHFYERPPYTTTRGHVCRFISLARLGSPSKQRFLYAASILPMSLLSRDQLTAVPLNSTLNPFCMPVPVPVTPDAAPTTGSLLPTPPMGQSPSLPTIDSSYQLPFSAPPDEGGRGGRGRRRGGRGGSKPATGGWGFAGETLRMAAPPQQQELGQESVGRALPARRGPGGDAGNLQKRPRADPGPCWFCLGNPTAERHLVVSVGEEAYIALPKGPLAPGHVLVLPIAHLAPPLLPSTRAEMVRHLGALRRFYEAGAHVALPGARGEEAPAAPAKKDMPTSFCFLERKLVPAPGQAPQHIFVEALPLTLLQEGAAVALFCDRARRHGLSFNEVPIGKSAEELVEAAGASDPQWSYVLVEFSTTRLLAVVPPDRYLPAQFSRQALASAIGRTEFADWHQCECPSKDVETTMATKFRDAFRKFDIMLNTSTEQADSTPTMPT